jgi:hypothetical protein
MRYARFLSVIGALLLATSAHANLIVNGSFEETPIASGDYGTYSEVYGWTVGSNGLELRDNASGVAQDGSNFAELDTEANSWISQTVSTVVGQEYSLSFYYSARAWVSADSNVITATVADSSGTTIASGSYTGDGSSGSTSWIEYTITFIATSTSTTITFAAAGTSDSVGGSLDNVTLSAVPEPSSIAMLLAGLGMMGFIARRRI